MKLSRTLRKEASGNNRARIAAAAVAVLLLFTLFTVAVSAAYDPASDPIVTLSYLNEKFLAQVENQMLDNLGFESYDSLKTALNKTAVDENALISRAKSSVLESFGYSSWSKAKTAFTTTTITESDRNKIADEAIAKLMTSLNISSTEELKTKLETVEQISQQTKLSLVNELGFDTIEDLRQALESGGSYKRVELLRGDRIVTVGDCDVICLNGIAALSSGTAIDTTKAYELAYGGILSEYSDSKVFSGAELVIASSKCVIMIRGSYIKTP